jgi:cation:H+ antiporter
VRGASRLAADLGITAAFVGLVIVAVGTSLPELATAMAAARRRETDLVLGNVLGSNLFNSLAVGGIAGLVGPGAVSATFRPAMVLMVASGALAGVLVWTGRRLERWEGAVLLAVFLAFVAFAAA